jgi:hypothetical protein
MWHYLILAIGIVVALAAMYYMYMGLKIIMKSLLTTNGRAHYLQKNFDKVYILKKSVIGI